MDEVEMGVWGAGRLALNGSGSSLKIDEMLLDACMLSCFSHI